MFKTWREQYREDRAQKRRIAWERWQQEKNWQEKQRADEEAARKKQRADEEAARKKQRADEEAVRKENAAGMKEHNALMRRASGASYLTLVLHEDTWTFLARTAFGIWEPYWNSSQTNALYNASPTTSQAEKFSVVPNLPFGRITRHPDGMLSVNLSGNNLVRLLEQLHAGTGAEPLADSARCRTLYDKLAGFVKALDPTAVSGRSHGVKYHIGDSVSENRLASSSAAKK